MSAKAKAKAAPKAAVIIDSPKAAEIIAILAAAKGYLINEAILAANVERLAADKTKTRLISTDITAYIGSPTRYNIWDNLVADLESSDKETREAAKTRLGGFRFRSLIGRGLVVADKGGVNKKGARVYRFSLTEFKD
jgi:hypothetical protein